jgi:hypothetical protein
MYNYLDIARQNVQMSLHRGGVEMSQTKYSRKLRNATWVAFLVPTVVALPMAYLLRGVAPGEHFWLVLAGGLFVVGTALWACVPWWRTMDDMQKQGHMISWYWGGLGGGLVAMIWLIAALGTKSPQGQGALTMFVGQAVGFFGFWAVWAWQRRGEKS